MLAGNIEWGEGGNEGARFGADGVFRPTRGEREFRACWPSFLGVLFLDPRSWILVLGVSWAC
jgi:hypothetical protein